MFTFSINPYAIGAIVVGLGYILTGLKEVIYAHPLFSGVVLAGIAVVGIFVGSTVVWGIYLSILKKSYPLEYYARELKHFMPLKQIETAEALGEMGQEAIPALEKVLREDENPDVRKAAAAALAEIGSVEVLPILLAAQKEEKDYFAGEAIGKAIIKIRPLFLIGVPSQIASPLVSSGRSPERSRGTSVASLPRNDGEEAQPLQTILQREFKGVTIEVMNIPPEAEPKAFMEGKIKERDARLGAILDKGADLTEEGELKEIKAKLAPLVNYLENEIIIGVSNKINRAIEEERKIAEREGRVYTEDIVKTIKGLKEKPTEEELKKLLAVVQGMFSPIMAVDWDKWYEEKQAEFAGVTTTYRTTIATSSTIEKPEVIAGLGKELKRDKDRNILVVTDAEVKNNPDKVGYIKRLDSILKERGEEGIGSFYKEENIVTLYELEEKLGEGKELSEETIAEAAETLVREKIGPEEEHGRIIYIEGEKAFADFAVVIIGLLRGEPEAIKRALELIGKEAKGLSQEDLARRVIDLRAPTKSLDTEREAERAAEQAI